MTRLVSLALVLLGCAPSMVPLRCVSPAVPDSIGCGCCKRWVRVDMGGLVDACVEWVPNCAVRP